MASSDFDDIFGDLKEDQQFSASLATGGGADLDDASIFGDASSAVMNTKSTTPAKPTSAGGAGGSEDEFLSWLDDAPPSAPSSSTSVTTSTDPVAKSSSGSLPAASTAVAPPKPPTMDTIDLGGDDDDDFLTTTRANSLDDEPLDSPASSAAVNPMPSSIPVRVASIPSPPPAPVVSQPPPPTTTTISLDDDDDDLEKIVQQATANARKTGGSRESSNSSLHIKSQTQSHRSSSTQFDSAALIKQYNVSGILATPAARLPMWHHALCGSSGSTKDSISMYAVQTTPLDLPNQPVLRKDVETMSAAIFSSALHAESLRTSSSSSSSSNDDGARLLFIDNAEILVTYLCKKLHLADYPPGFAFAFGPAIAVGGNDPLRMDLIATIQAACQQMLPHLSQQIAPRVVADARRALLKWLLLYHAPSVAFHLDQHFHEWNASGDAATIPDAWLCSMFESDSYRSGFDFLVKVWDCCTLLDVRETLSLAATKAFPSTTACFVVIYLVAKAEKKLLRMEGDQLRHCMTETLIDVLKDKNADVPLVLGVRALIEATPPSICVKLRDAGLVALEDVSVTADTGAAAMENKAAKPFSLLSASTNGVMQVGSAVGSAVNTMVIDMPTKLLTTIVPIKFSLSSSSSSSTGKDPAVSEEFFTQLMREATPASSVCLTLAASEVIPQVFRSFQAPPPSDEKIRYFIVDCRARDETTQGQIPTAFHFDPDAVTDPAVLDTVLATLNPLKTTVHMVVMGHGYGHIADDLRQLLAAQQATNDTPFFLKDEFLESFARDISRVNAAVLFLAKRGFPHVSVLDGGYAAAHTQLLHSASEGFCVADLIDHDAPKCSLCQHRRPSVSSAGSFSARTESQRRRSIITSEAGASDGRASPPASRGSSGATLPQQTGPKLSGSSSGELDAKALFDGHASPSGGGNTYFSSFAGALKTGGKAMGMMNPANSMAGGSKWLMGMKGSSGSGSAPSSPVPAGDTSGNRSPLATGGMANLSKLKNSLSQIGSESLDMLKKAEQAAAKTSQLKGMFGSMSSSNLKAAAASPAGSPASTPTGVHTGSGSLPRTTSFQRAEEEVFTIDDDDEEEQDDFVGGSGSGRGSSRTSSSSSMTGHRTESFAGSPTEAGGMPSTVVLHTVDKGKVKELTKGMRVSRTQMLPFVESPFFSAYKKKQAAPTAAAAAPSRASMLPRRLVVAENHVVVLKAERNMDDVYSVKSCHHLSHLGRMTCLKKNALMVTLYYKWKAPHSSEIMEKKNAYEVQQRDEFIKVIKIAMEKM